MATKRIKRDAGTAWLEKTNPLKGLSISEAQAIFDNARQGDTQRLHWIFQEIESANPTLMTCVERRVSALAGIDWGVTVRPRADQSLGEEQQAAVEGFISTIENFDEMIEHLDLAFFRGFSYAQPLWEADGSVRHISLLDSWCFLMKDGRLFYNPVCDGFTRNCEEVTREAGLIGIRRRRWIDYPALSIHIRNAVGERDWGRFLERIALPKPAVIMGPNPTPEQRNDYVAVAEDVEDGKVSVWPNGTILTDFMGGSRGQDPFSAFIRHQDEKIVLLSTGGTLTSLAQADTGALAGGAQMDVWREIVVKDAKAIEGAVMRALVLPFLERKFQGRPCAIDFTFDRTKKLTAKESAEVAVALKNAGYLVVQSELEAATGFTLEKAPEPPAQPMPGLAMAKAKEAEPQAPRKALADTLQDALEAAMVEAIAGELQTAKATLNDAAAVGTSEGAKKGWETRRRNGWTSEQFAEASTKVGGLVDELSKRSPDGKHPGWSHREESLGKLDAGTIADIKAAAPSMNVDASEMTVDTTQLQHALNHHGVGRETNPNQVAITSEDLKRVPDVLSDYDEIVAGSGKASGKHHDAVIFRKKYDDGTLCCVEVDQYSEKRKGRILRFKTMWKEKTV